MKQQLNSRLFSFNTKHCTINDAILYSAVEIYLIVELTSTS